MGSTFGGTDCHGRHHLQERTERLPTSQFPAFPADDAAINRGIAVDPGNMRGEVIGVNSRLPLPTGDYNGLGLRFRLRSQLRHRQIVFRARCVAAFGLNARLSLKMSLPSLWSTRGQRRECDGCYAD